MNHPVGRNDPCPCGSGLKFKKCCMERSQSTKQDMPDDASRILSQAYKSLGDEKWSEAASLFQEVLPTVKNPHLIYEAIASCYDGLEDYSAASEYYEKALACCPPGMRYKVSFWCGMSLACAEQWDKAIEAFRTHLDLENKERRRTGINGLINTLKDIRDGKEKPDVIYVEVQLQRAFSEMEDDRFDDAAKRLERISQRDPENPSVLFNLGVAYSFSKREDDALEKFQDCVNINPAMAHAFYNMGQIYLISKRDFSKALNCFAHAASVRPDYVSAHHQKGKAYELLGHPLKAIECWQKTVELDPDNQQARDNITRVRDSLNKADDAEKATPEE